MYDASAMSTKGDAETEGTATRKLCVSIHFMNTIEQSETQDLKLALKIFPVRHKTLDLKLNSQIQGEPALNSVAKW